MTPGLKAIEAELNLGVVLRVAKNYASEYAGLLEPGSGAMDCVHIRWRGALKHEK